MKSMMRVRSAFAAGGLAALAAVGFASPVFAASSDVNTPGWFWNSVWDSGQTIEDVSAFHENYMGTGLDIWGSNDAFDGFFSPSPFNVTYPAYADQSVSLASVSATYVGGGVSTIVGGASVDFGGGITFDMSATLTIQGSYAKWDFAFANTGTGDLAQLGVAISGNLGSDLTTDYALVDANSWISTDGGPTGENGDPVLGWHFATAGAWSLNAVDGDDQMEIDFAAGPATLTVSLLELDACTFDAAVAAMTALVPTLPATFGATNTPLFSTNCLAIGAPTAITLGTSTNQVLSLTETGGLVGSPLYGADAADYLRMTPLNLPAGMALALEFDAGTGFPSLRLTGTAPAGTTVVSVLTYLDGGGGDFYYPLVSTFTLRSELAETGSNAAMTASVSGGLILAGLGLVVLARRFRRSVT